MRNRRIYLIVSALLFLLACTPEKESDSIYDYPDNTNTRNDDDSIETKTDSDLTPNDKEEYLDNEDIPDNVENPDDPSVATCGNDQIDFGEICEKNSIVMCVDIDPASFTGGEAFCNEYCTGWDISKCDKLSCKDAVDNPDDAFADTNCDGIDGDASASVFVDKINGNNLNAGSKGLPVSSITKALQIAEEEGKKHVLVATGDYSETVELKDGISIHGAYSGHPEWKRGIENEVQISNGNPAVRGVSVNKLTMAYITIKSANNFSEGLSSTGVFLKNCSEIFLNNVDINSGHGGDGQDGTAGTEGAFAGNGLAGEFGCEEGGIGCGGCSRPLGGAGGTSSCGMTGGKGGDAGHASNSGSPGTTGEGLSGIGGNGGTSPYSGDLCPENSIKGKDGLNGVYGDHGISGKAFGGYDENGYIQGKGGDGEDGSNAHGGGGGGGGKGGDSFCKSYGSSGGGGGGGGCGGSAGTGGAGGGGSFGLWADNCSDIILRGVKIDTSDGGRGGNGGNGGVGGIGGTGGTAGTYGGSSEQDDGGCGGNGGSGGRGGNGGSGGGGGGGPSIGIVNIKSSFDGIMYVTFLIGKGGAGGKSDSNEGFPGEVDQVSEF